MIYFQGPIPIAIYPIFWAVAILLGWLNSGTLIGTALWVGIILVSLLVHEFGHALTAMFFGQKSKIILTATGGLTVRDAHKRDSAWKEFLIVFNGPLAGFILYLVCSALSHSFTERSPIISQIFYLSAIANFFWTVVNLLPIQPLDGGKLLLVLFEGLFGLKGEKIALMISAVVSIALAALSLLFTNWILLGAILLILAFENVRALREIWDIRAVDRNHELQEQLEMASQFMDHEEIEKASDLLQLIRRHANRGHIYNQATERLAKIYVSEEKYQTAYDLLNPLESQISHSGMQLEQYCAFKIKRWDEAIRLGNLAYNQFPNAHVAILNAMAHAVRGELIPTIGWLKCAQEVGIDNLLELLNEDKFDRVRETKEFKEFSLSLR